MSGARSRLVTGLAQVEQRLVPDLAAESMVGKQLHVLGEPVSQARFDGPHDLGVERPPPLHKQTTVGDLVGQGVLERVLGVGEEASLVQELGRLETGESERDPVLIDAAHALEQGQGYVLPHDGGGLKELLVLGVEAVDAGRENGVDRGRHLEARDGTGEPIRAALARERSRFEQGPDALLQEQWVALGAVDQQPLERLEPRVVPK